MTTYTTISDTLDTIEELHKLLRLEVAVALMDSAHDDPQVLAAAQTTVNALQSACDALNALTDGDQQARRSAMLTLIYSNQ